jgi:hypothetical protein
LYVLALMMGAGGVCTLVLSPCGVAAVEAVAADDDICVRVRKRKGGGAEERKLFVAAVCVRPHAHAPFFSLLLRLPRDAPPSSEFTSHHTRHPFIGIRHVLSDTTIIIITTHVDPTPSPKKKKDVDASSTSH